MNTDYPDIEQYKQSVAQLGNTIRYDPLKKGKSVQIDPITQLPRAYSGGNAAVFEIVLPDQKKVALKCWTTDMHMLGQRYRVTSPLINQFDFFSNAIFHEQGIDVGGKLWPIGVIDWVEGDNLIEFIEKCLDFKKGYHNVQAIYDVAGSFLNTVKTLHQRGISHGDLQHENIRITADKRLKIIDYDDLFVPGLERNTYLTIGKPGYQHTHRPGHFKELTVYTDYFSELVIFTSLLALIVKPDLWKTYGQDDERLLFRKADFVQPASSTLLGEMKELGSRELCILAETLQKFCMEDNLIKLQPLEKVVAQWPDTLENFGHRYLRDRLISFEDAAVAPRPSKATATRIPKKDPLLIPDLAHYSLPSSDSKVPARDKSREVMLIIILILCLLTLLFIFDY